MSERSPRRGPTPSSIDERDANLLADTMFALSTPSRVLILGCLLDGPHSVGDLTGRLAMEQSAVSHQLRVLRDHDLVRADKVGRRRVYALFDDHVAALITDGLRHVKRTGTEASRRTTGHRVRGNAS